MPLLEMRHFSENFWRYSVAREESVLMDFHAV